MKANLLESLNGMTMRKGHPSDLHPLMAIYQPPLMHAIKHRAVGAVVWDTPSPLKSHQDGAHAVHHDDDDAVHGHGGAPYMVGGLMGGMAVGIVRVP